MALASFNLDKWIDENRHLLRPPVLNQTIFAADDLIVMIVGGPNVRTDYHDDPYEEFFYQLKGNMVLKVVEDGELRDVPIDEGNIFLLPPHVPHSPQRPDPESIGLVVERIRPEGVEDAFEWYCENCSTRIWRREVRVDNIVTDLPPVFDEYYGSVAEGNCAKCGHPHPKKISAA
jgi:3-hydroxyanthranilate 3,4-dioxygenase